MKKSLLLRLAIFGFVGFSVLPSCKKTQSENTSDNTVEESKIDPKEEVTTFVNEFVKNLGANLRDSVAYPEILLADSITPVSADSISISEAAPGQFDVQLSDGITMKVNRNENGKISVAESHGLFVFPKDKVEIAKKTGMWDDTLSDAKLNERMNDEDFFQYIKNKTPKGSSNYIQIGGFVRKGDRGYYTLKNTTDQPIKGSEYSIVVKTSVPVYDPEGGLAVDHWEKKQSLEAGKDLQPHGTAQVYSEYVATFFGGDVGPEKTINGIKWKLSPAQLQEKFAAFKGTEYQEYLYTKK